MYSGRTLSILPWYSMSTFLYQAPQHPLMVKERAGSSVRPLQLAYVLYGGRAAFERMVEIQAQFEADPVFDRCFLF